MGSHGVAGGALPASSKTSGLAPSRLTRIHDVLSRHVLDFWTSVYQAIDD